MRLAIPGSRPGQSAIHVRTTKGDTIEHTSLPAVEYPYYIAPASRRPLPAAAYGLARCALFGAHALECTPLVYGVSALAAVPNEAGYHAQGTSTGVTISQLSGG